MSQAQRVDLNIAQLRFYLREHELRAAAAAVLSGQAALAAVPVLSANLGAAAPVP